MLSLCRCGVFFPLNYELGSCNFCLGSAKPNPKRLLSPLLAPMSRPRPLFVKARSNQGLLVQLKHDSQLAKDSL